MPLTADQRALLELLLQRDQSYADIASLLEVSEPEVRARAREALTELGGADPDRNVALTDWLLGQADPIGRADAARHVKEDAEDHRLATSLIESLRQLAPGADYPKLPPEPSGGRFMRRAPAAEPAAPPTPKAPSRSRRDPGRLHSLTETQTRTFVMLGAGAVLLIAVVLAIAGVFSGDEDSSTSSAATDGTTTQAADGTATDQDIQTVELRPTSGGDAEGTATFGIASGSQAFVELDISNLEPAPANKAYVLWLMISEDEGHPLSPFQASQNGSYSERIPIASFLTQLAARTQFVDVSLSEREPLLTAVQKAVDKGSPIIPFTGESILRGSVEAATTGGGQGGGQ